MILAFATKRGANGLRKWLVIDTDRQELATDCRRFCPSRDSFIEIKETDRTELYYKFVRYGYEKVDYCKEA